MPKRRKATKKRKRPSPAGLNPRQQIFADLVLRGLPASRAYAKAYKCKEKSARERASKLSTNVNVSRYLSDHRQAASDAVAIDREWVLMKLRKNLERAEDADGKYHGSVVNRAAQLIGLAIGVFREPEKLSTDFGDAVDPFELSLKDDAGYGSDLTATPVPAEQVSSPAMAPQVSVADIFGK